MPAIQPACNGDAPGATSLEVDTSWCNGQKEREPALREQLNSPSVPCQSSPSQETSARSFVPDGAMGGQGRAGSGGGARAVAAAASHGGRVVTISSVSQPGPQVTVGGPPRPEGGPRESKAVPPPHHPHHPVRAPSPHRFHRGPPISQYGGGAPGNLPPEQQHFRGEPFGDRGPQLPPLMGPPGLHMPTVPSLPPFPPYPPQIFAEPPFRGHPHKLPPPMFEGSQPFKAFSGPPPQQQQQQQPPPWVTDMYGLPDMHPPYPPFFKG